MHDPSHARAAYRLSHLDRRAACSHSPETFTVPRLGGGNDATGRFLLFISGSSLTAAAVVSPSRPSPLHRAATNNENEREDAQTGAITRLTWPACKMRALAPADIVL